MPEHSSFPALERLKSETDGLDVLIEVAPPGVAATFEWLFNLDYTERKRKLLARRESVRKSYQHHRQRVEQTYGSAVIRALDRRADGQQPRFAAERMETELDDAVGAIQTLYKEVEEDYLTRAEYRQLTKLEADVKDAHEYVRNKAEFDRRRKALETELERFEEQFEPYVGAEQYMISSDHETLMTLSYEIWTELAALARELVLPVLPDEDANWLAEHKTRFSELVDYLPDYNEEFVASERERYVDLLVTEHGQLNDQQQKAVIRDDRRNLVDASAGTGKTLTLTYRFIYLLEKGIAASDIAAITYTSDAAEEMKGRIAAATDVSEEDLNVSTIHSFANQIVREANGGGESNLGGARDQLVTSYQKAAQAGHEPERADVEFRDRYAVFKQGYDRFMQIEGDHGEGRKGYIQTKKQHMEPRSKFIRRKLEEFVEQARTFGISPEEIRMRLDGTSQIRDTFGTAGAALVEAYGRIVEREDVPTDFDDMIYTATDIVQSNPERFGDRYSHLLVDEFQDISDATLAFVESFMGGESEPHLFCVGDDWQSIYGFNGSNVRYFTEYEDRYDDVSYTELQVNYRCPPAIVEAGADLMAQSSAPQNEKAVRADSDLETTPTVHTIDILYEARGVPYVADMVETELEDRDPDEVMVLSRNDKNSKYMQLLRKELKRRKIPHRRPKNIEDYLPEEYRTSLPYDVVFDDQKHAKYDVSEGVEPTEEEPPLVRTQSIHNSKGTEAPIVILLHGVDDDPDGIPIEERVDKVLEPAMDITANHIPEERRLFYVALTRAEEEFHAVTQSGGVSRYIEEITEHFQRREVPFPEELVGQCTSFEMPDQSNHPVKATLDCGVFKLPLLSWPDQNPPQLEEGATYRIRVTDPSRQIDRDDYGEEIRFDQTPIERVDSSKRAAKDV